MLQKVAFIVALVAIVGLGSYRVGEGQGRKSGYTSGREAGYSVGQAAGRAEQERVEKLLGDGWQTSYKGLETDYNKLVKDYNALLRYANTPQYQPRQPIHCSSTTLSTTTYTNCY